MEKTHNISESSRRLYEKLHHDLGMDILAFLKDHDVNEIMLNPDGSLWIDRASIGQVYVAAIPKAQAFSIIHAVAGIHNFVVNQHNPLLEAELPCFQEMQNERFTGQLPPVASAPCFTIRKKSTVIYTLDDYVATARLTKDQAEILRTLTKERKNILVCGGPGSGKTTVTNALITE